MAYGGRRADKCSQREAILREDAGRAEGGRQRKAEGGHGTGGGRAWGGYRERIGRA